MQVDKDYAVSEILKTFDQNTDGRIEEHEFVEGCKKWIHEAKQLAKSGDSTPRKFLREASYLFDGAFQLISTDSRGYYWF